MLIAPWFFIAAAVLLLGIAIAIALIARSRPVRGNGEGSDSGALRVTRVVALIYAAILLLATAFETIVTLVSEQIEVTVPIMPYWPGLAPGTTVLDGPSAEIVGGGFTEATLTIAGLGIDARLLLVGQILLLGLTHVLVAVVVAELCRRLLAGDPFRRVLSRSVSIVAVAVAAGGFLSQLLFGIGSSIAAEQALRVTAWSSESSSPDAPLISPLPEPMFSMNLDFTPILVGLALIAVAAAFRVAERLQRDTEGLV